MFLSRQQTASSCIAVSQLNSSYVLCVAVTGMVARGHARNSPLILLSYSPHPSKLTTILPSLWPSRAQRVPSRDCTLLALLALKNKHENSCGTIEQKLRPWLVLLRLELLVCSRREYVSSTSGLTNDALTIYCWQAGTPSP